MHCDRWHQHALFPPRARARLARRVVIILYNCVNSPGRKACDPPGSSCPPSLLATRVRSLEQRGDPPAAARRGERSRLLESGRSARGERSAASNALKNYAKRRGSVDVMAPAISALQAYATRRASVQESYARTRGSVHATLPAVSVPNTIDEISADALQDYRRRHALLMEHYANEKRAEKTALMNVVPPTKLSKARSV